MTWHETANEILAEIKKTWCMLYPGYQNQGLKCKITPLKSIKQIGPTCGLVVLCMAEPLSDFSEPRVTIDLLYNEAKKRGFTKLGEMFSTSQMCEMADLFLANWYKIYHINYSLIKDKSFIVKLIKDDCLIIICYDDDRNMMPTVNQGHTAHWAIICGMIGEDHVIARHGKKSKYSVWPINDLAASNDGLIEVKPTLYLNMDHYVIPKDGIIKKSLASQFMVLKPKNKSKILQI
ncbi:UPF0692 protein CG33108-like isoform X2 [Daktulosphaira vitifoliae]|uniref:UPF0692 protein CG33108-like isoform X2 n=1 Tax=Daktulosphaira vitifoliae TaxID=58002 RepID=UPI0021AA44F0|nr:UPF0692 protein CG33108-like isoform X2 [Daktulosphaira vitifoliae]